MIAYILSGDVTAADIKRYQKECPFVTVRIFNAAKYPSFVKNLFEYRWKSLLVEEVLQEVEKVIWFDASIIFKSNANETIMEIVQKMDTKFSKCGIRDFGESGHSILFATHPKMLQYFNMSEETAKNNIMIAGGLFIISRKGSNILQKWNKCALEKECMAPEGSELYCTCGECRTKNIYGNCHRFDQAVLSILTLQCSSNLKDFYQPSTLISTY
uniref:Uncharacterized protein n=1 Tax=Panagrolaimus sp. ES5 TaxID=591445 RepID=A0AC34F5E2_9BILA